MKRQLLLVVGIFSFVLSACGSSGHSSATSVPPSTTAVGSTTAPEATTWSGTPTPSTAIPLDDGHVSSTPKVGYVDSCVTTFNGGPGPSTTGPWINQTTKTWDATAKPHVQGTVSWPAAAHSFTLTGSSRVLTTNDLPEGETTGTFPISPTDPVHQYTGNPNQIAAPSYRWVVPADPTEAAAPSCVGLGSIGVSNDGVVFFDALDAKGHDAGAHEVFDRCDGHPDMSGTYHYHVYSPCLNNATTKKPGASVLIGYALDGFGIYLQRDSHGALPTDSDLDACHGIVSQVTWNGKPTKMFHYDITATYPFTVGCYYGTPVNTGTGPNPGK